MLFSSETILVVGPIVAATLMAAVGIYVKDMVITSIKRHLTEVLPGLFAIEFGKWRDKADSTYAPHDVVNTVQRLEDRVKVMELGRVGG